MEKILKLRISLSWSSPSVWREVLISQNSTFEELHKIIQICFGWTNSHLYMFRFGDITISAPDPDMSQNADVSPKNQISEYLYQKEQTGVYTYDFGDNWDHLIEVLDILPREENATVPVCIAGQYNGPPEDCGGPPGFEELKTAMGKKRSALYRQMVEWLGRPYDFEYFDIDDINQAIKEPDKYFVEDLFD